MKICFFLHSAGMAGAERVNLELIQALTKRDIECCAILPAKGPVIDVLQQYGVSTRIISYRPWMREAGAPFWKRFARIIVNLSRLFPVIRQIKAWKPDLVYTNTQTVCSGAVAAKIIGIAHVWHIHEFGYEDFELVCDLGQSFTFSMIERLSDQIIVSSEAVREKFKPYFTPEKLNLIYYAVSVQEEMMSDTKQVFQSLKKIAEKRIMMVGTLHSGKRQEDAIRATAELIKKGIKVKLFLIGEGSRKYKTFLRRLIKENSLGKHVYLCGYVGNPFPLMKEANALLVCSRNEAFGRVTVEGMKAGIPVIGANSGGTSELIVDYHNGLLYDRGDYRMLASKIRYIYEHPEEAVQMGKNGQQWAKKKFNIERFSTEMTTLFGQVLKKRAKKVDINV